jgi:hypothetical protein
MRCESNAPIIAAHVAQYAANHSEADWIRGEGWSYAIRHSLVREKIQESTPRDTRAALLAAIHEAATEALRADMLGAAYASRVDTID